MVALTADDLAAVPAVVIERLLGARRVLAVCHRDPEADALGSVLAIAAAREALGFITTAVCADAPPRMYDFMPGIDRFRQSPVPDLDYDLIVVCDCGDLARVGSVLEGNAELFGRVPVMDIVHHGSNPGFGAVDWVDPAAAATCELVTLLLPRLGVPLDAREGEIATNLMAGVVIDTATFQHPNTTPRTLRVGSELLAAGAPLSEISRRLYRTKPTAQLQLFGVVLGRLQHAADGALVWSSLTPSDLDVTGASPELSEGLIDLLAQSASSEVVILFRDQRTRTRISVRTRDRGADAIELTRRFGGGGHARAAGATIELPIDEARSLVLPLAERLAREARDGRATAASVRRA
jgi:phosphoesterase RecJ-like protein